MKHRTLAIIVVLLLTIPAVAGTWTSNSFIYKPGTGARGEPENKTFDNGLDRVDARLGKETWLGDPGGSPGYDTLPHAITTIASTPTVLHLPPGIISIDADTAIPANITLKPVRGAIFSIAAGKTLTISGSLDAGPYQIFSGAGVVNLGGQSVPFVYAEWWGAKADYGVPSPTDNRVPIRAALQCLETRGGGVLRLLSRGNYVVTNGASAGDPGVWLSGTATSIAIEGNNAYLIGPTCNGPILKLGEAYDTGTHTNKMLNIVVRDLNISGAGSAPANLAAYPYQDGLYIGNSSRVSIENVYISNIARNGIAGKKNVDSSSSRYWNRVALINVKVTGVGNAGLVVGLNNHDDPLVSPADDITMLNCCFNQLGKAYPTPDAGYTNTQAGVIILAYTANINGLEIAGVNYVPDASYNDKVTSGRFAAAGWTYGAGWTQDAGNYEADAVTASSDLEQNLTSMEDTTYTVSFAVRNRSAGTVTPYIGAVAGVAVNANGSYCQTITTGATGTLALKFTGAGFTGSITDVRVMKSPRGLNTGLYMRYAQGIAINGIHCEMIGANQLNSRDVYLEGCSGSINGYNTYMDDPLTARYGIYLVNCRGLVINGALITSANGYSMHNLVYFDSNCKDCLALGLSKGVNTGSTAPFGGWVSHSGTGGGVFSQLGIFPTDGGTYNGNIFFTYNDRYASIDWRSGTTTKTKIQGDASAGDFYMDITRKLLWRDMSGNTKMTLDLSKGVLNLAALTAAPSAPTTGDIACADRTTWDPLSKGSGGSYLVRWNGSAWVAIDSQ